MPSIVVDDDFTANALADNSVTVTHTPVTKTLKAMGGETLTDGSPVSLSVILDLDIDQFTQEEHGLLKETDAYIMLGGSTTITKDDKFAFNGVTYRVLNVRVYGPSGDVSFHQFVELKLIG